MKKIDIALLVYAVASALTLGTYAFAGTSGFPPRVISPVAPPPGPTPEPIQVIVVNSASIGSGSSGGGLTDAELRASSVPVSDGGASLTVDGTFFQVTQPVSAAALPLPSGAATSALQTQPGVDIGDVTINNAAGGSAVNIQDGGNAITVDGTVGVSSMPALAAGTNNIGDVDIASGTLTTVGTVTTVSTVTAVTSITNPVAVTGPLTDAQLRAVPVPISGAVSISSADVATSYEAGRGSAAPDRLAVVAGVDAAGLAQPVLVTPQGAIVVTEPVVVFARPNGLVPRCNKVRRLNCNP